jgi:hypothetical protein
MQLLIIFYSWRGLIPTRALPAFLQLCYNLNMTKRKCFTCGKMPLLALCAFLLAFPVFAQGSSSERGDLWFCPGAEAALYSPSGMAFGGGLALGYGRGTAIGFKAAYYIDTGGIGTLEFNFLLRLYFLGILYSHGPFIQFGGGPAIFIKDNNFSFSSVLGTISTGLSAGWRFPVGNLWFFEPSIRVGYPYLVGMGLSMGMHF